MTAPLASAAAVHDTLKSAGLGQHFGVDDRGLVIKGDPPFEAWEELWERLLKMERTIQFVIGEAMKHIRERWGHEADQIISHRVGLSLETLRTYEWTHDKVPKDVRRLDVLTYSHHQAVAKLAPPEQKKYLDAAADGDADTGQPWSVGRLKAAVKAGGDVPVRSWVLVVHCDTERKRDRLQSELEGRGLRCRPSEKRSAT